MPISEQQANELFRILAADPAQPFKADAFCSARSDLMTGRLLQNGVNLRDIGQAIIFAPPKFLFAERPSARPVLKTSSLLEVPYVPGQEARSGDYIFQVYKALNGHPRITILDAVNRVPIKVIGQTYVQSNGGMVFWSHHIAPTLKVTAADGQKKLLILDPRLADHPLTPQEWKDKLNCPLAIFMHAEWSNNQGQNGPLNFFPQDELGIKMLRVIAKKIGITRPLSDLSTTDHRRLVRAVSDNIISDGTNRFFTTYSPPTKERIELNISFYENWLKPLRALQTWMETNAAGPNHDPRATLTSRQTSLLNRTSLAL